MQAKLSGETLFICWDSYKSLFCREMHIIRKENHWKLNIW